MLYIEPDMFKVRGSDISIIDGSLSTSCACKVEGRSKKRTPHPTWPASANCHLPQATGRRLRSSCRCSERYLPFIMYM